MENLKKEPGLTDGTTMYVDRKVYLYHRWWKKEGKRIFKSWLKKEIKRIIEKQ